MLPRTEILYAAILIYEVTNCYLVGVNWTHVLEKSAHVLEKSAHVLEKSAHDAGEACSDVRG